jgi:hypothetical protein
MNAHEILTLLEELKILKLGQVMDEPLDKISFGHCQQSHNEYIPETFIAVTSKSFTSFIVLLFTLQRLFPSELFFFVKEQRRRVAHKLDNSQYALKALRSVHLSLPPSPWSNEVPNIVTDIQGELCGMAAQECPRRNQLAPITPTFVAHVDGTHSGFASGCNPCLLCPITGPFVCCRTCPEQ